MGVYVILIFVPILIQHIKISNKDHNISYKKKNTFALTLFFLMLTILIMFRHERVGNDTRNYIYYFNKIASREWNELQRINLEIGYVYLNKIISLIIKDARYFLILTAAFVSILIYPTYKRLCIDTTLTIVLFSIMSTFVMLFSGIRQSLAIGLGFVAYEFVRKKKILYFVLIVCLAITFHTSAFMLFFMYPLYYVKITKKKLYIVIPLLLIIFIFNGQIFASLSYIVSQFTKYENIVTSTGAYMMIILFAVFTIYSFVIPNETKIDEETYGLRNFLLMSLVIQLFAPVHTLAMRMSYYFIIFIPLLIPKIIEYKTPRWRQVAIMSRYIMVIFFVLYFFLVRIQSADNLNIYPYCFFWQNI